jgi:U8 snoRNA-decapping enzyme
MQLRFDGCMGFPGGIVCRGEDIVLGLNRELVEEMNVDVQKHAVKEEHYVVSHCCPSRNLVLHFYALEVSIDDLKVAEENALKARDYGTEVIIQFRLCILSMVLKKNFSLAASSNVFV